MTEEMSRPKVPAVKRSDLVRWAGEDDVVRLDPSLGRLWDISDVARSVLVEVGLPRYHRLFVPALQTAAEPAWPPYYLLGREEFGRHSHEEADIACGCGLFGLDPCDGTVWQVYPGEPTPSLFVNSNLQLLVYFLGTLGAASCRYRDLPDRDMIRRTERVMERLRHWEPALASGRDSFWKLTFERAWG